MLGEKVQVKTLISLTCLFIAARNSHCVSIYSIKLEISGHLFVYTTKRWVKWDTFISGLGKANLSQYTREWDYKSVLKNQVLEQNSKLNYRTEQ